MPEEKKKEKVKLIIRGVNLNLKSSDIRNARSASDLQKLDIFSHLEPSDKERACEEAIDALMKIDFSEED